MEIGNTVKIIQRGYFNETAIGIIYLSFRSMPYRVRYLKLNLKDHNTDAFKEEWLLELNKQNY